MLKKILGVIVLAIASMRLIGARMINQRLPSRSTSTSA
jgi:hypothetical protein